jgi:hypothetical protein
MRSVFRYDVKLESVNYKLKTTNNMKTRDAVFPCENWAMFRVIAASELLLRLRKTPNPH